MRKFCIALFLTCFTILPVLSKGASAALLRVPSQHATIQAAINAASHGDEVLVDNGTYVENINFLGKRLNVHSENGAGVTIIDGDQNGITAVTFENGETTASILDGFTITKGYNYTDSWYGYSVGGGIECRDSSPTIINCNITDNQISLYVSYGGGGIFCKGTSSPVIKNCDITNNKAGFGSGGGIGIEDGGSPLIENCNISGNYSEYGGGGIALDNASATITGCNIYGNETWTGGGGIGCYKSSPTITNCNIQSNELRLGGGGIGCNNSSPIINNCTILDNICTQKGGAGIGCTNYSNPTITNSLISENGDYYVDPATGNRQYARGSGGIGLSTSSPTIKNCIITDNIGGSRGGGIGFLIESSPVIINTTIANNYAHVAGGGIFAGEDPTSSGTVINSIIWGNTTYDEVADEIVVADGASVAVTYSDVRGGYTGVGNKDEDPLFIGSGDYHLQGGSPCIDEGDPASAPPTFPADDIDGVSRPQFVAYDMGAVEYTGSELSSNLSSPTDDAEEYWNCQAYNDCANHPNGLIKLASNDLDMGHPQMKYVGLRFQNLDIPNGAMITNAYVEFVGSETNSGTVTLRIRCEDSDNASPFLSTPLNIGNRSKTSADTFWSPGAWTAGSTYQTDNFASSVQEVVKRTGWSTGNTIAVLITRSSGDGSGDDVRAAVSDDANPNESAILHVEYQYVPGMFEAEVDNSSGDSEEYWNCELFNACANHPNGMIKLASGDLDIGHQQIKYVGIRFENLNIPQGVTVTNAYIEFVGDEANSGAVTVKIRCEDADNSAPFTNTAFNLGNRSKTTAETSWSPGAWTVDSAYQTDNFASSVQEVINRGGWSPMNAIAVLITRISGDGNGDDMRAAASYDATSGASAPILHIEYDEP